MSLRASIIGVLLLLGAPLFAASPPRSALSNSNPDYKTLRTGELRHVYLVANLTVNRDAGVFTFRSGSFSFLPPVQSRVTTGVFIGDGNFHLDPGSAASTLRLKRMTGTEAVDEDFSALVVFFSDITYDEIRQHSELVDESPEKHEEALRRVRDVIRGRRLPRLPPSPPRSELENLLNYVDIPNYDAEVLAEVYNGMDPARSCSFRAFLHGKRHADLRFLFNSRGALPVFAATEEVALLNFNPVSNSDGVWYLEHARGEHQSERAAPKEDKRLLGRFAIVPHACTRFRRTRRQDVSHLRGAIAGKLDGRMPCEPDRPAAAGPAEFQSRHSDGQTGCPHDQDAELMPFASVRAVSR